MTDSKDAKKPETKDGWTITEHKEPTEIPKPAPDPEPEKPAPKKASD